MAEFVWSEQDTSPGRIEAALRQLLQQSHAEDAFIPARVLNLIAVVDREWRGEIENRLERVGRYHPSRTIICSIEPGRTQLDAVAILVRPGHERARAARDRVGDGDGGLRPGARAAARRARGRARRHRSPDRGLVTAPPSGGDRRRAVARAGGPDRLDRGAEPRGRGRPRGPPGGGRVRRRPRLAALDPLARARGGHVRPRRSGAPSWGRSRSSPSGTIRTRRSRGFSSSAGSAPGSTGSPARSSSRTARSTATRARAGRRSTCASSPSRGRLRPAWPASRSRRHPA